MGGAGSAKAIALAIKEGYSEENIIFISEEDIKLRSIDEFKAMGINPPRGLTINQAIMDSITIPIMNTHMDIPDIKFVQSNKFGYGHPFQKFIKGKRKNNF